MLTLDDLATLRDTAIRATSPGPDKWTSNAELISWFRSNPVAVLDALIAGMQILDRPGGLNNTHFRETMRGLPDLPEVAA